VQHPRVISAGELAAPEESVTSTVKEKVPASVGVPLISPVEAFKSRPGGNEPSTIDHV
jgi:hypothetical protein